MSPKLDLSQFVAICTCFTRSTQ